MPPNKMDDENEEIATPKVAKFDEFMESADTLTMKDVFLENTHLRGELRKLEGENITLKQANKNFKNESRH